MGNVQRYRIVDEPAPSGVAHLAVRPLWPLLGLMLGGAWLAWPWFVLNAIALGARSKTRLLAWIGGTIAVCLAVAGPAVVLAQGGRLPQIVVPWVGFVLVICKLTVGYVATEQQTQPAELHAHFGGRLRNGLPIVLAAFFLGRDMVARLLHSIDGDAAAIAWLVLS